MTSTILSQPSVRLIIAKSEKFPQGNRAAFNALESHLKTLKGRKFYGLVYPSNGAMEYYAGLVPDSEIEERRFAALGFPVRVIPGGRCARVKMLDWNTRTDQIGPTIGAMIQQHAIDPSRPQMEYYRRFSELHLLLPIPELK
jgi:hypothetical protein